MVNQKLVAISYICTFLVIYLCAIAYAIIPTVLNNTFHTSIDLPTTHAMNETITAVSSISGGNILWILIIIIVLIALFVIFSSLAMFNAY